MVKRTIIKIDEDRCTGCGICATGCPEGALQIIDRKARLVSEIFCDGLGACIGTCPEGAIITEEREAHPYSESETMVNIAQKGINTIKAHLDHLKSHGQAKYYDEAVQYLQKNHFTIPQASNSCQDQGCPGSRILKITPKSGIESKNQGSIVDGVKDEVGIKIESELRQWPIQIKLLPIQAPFFNQADLLIASDCVGFSNPNFHQTLLKGKTLLVGCPKLDDSQYYIDKLTQIFALNSIQTITIAMMEVPCCWGLGFIVEEALKKANKRIPVKKLMYSTTGELKPNKLFN